MSPDAAEPAEPRETRAPKAGPWRMRFAWSTLALSIPALIAWWAGMAWAVEAAAKSFGQG